MRWLHKKVNTYCSPEIQIEFIQLMPLIKDNRFQDSHVTILCSLWLMSLKIVLKIKDNLILTLQKHSLSAAEGQSFAEVDT